MKQKIEQLNQSYKKALGLVIQEEFPEEGIVIEDLLLDSSMKHGRVWLICQPEQLERVQKKSGRLQSLAQDHVKTRYTPVLEFLITDRYLDKLDSLFSEIENESK